MLAGCASQSGTSGGSGGPTAAPGGGGATTVSQRVVPGAGPTLVDAAGHPLYFTEQEADGTIHCVAMCVQFWAPLTVPAGATPTAGVGVTGTLATVSRPDNLTQVTYNGKPLYTFSLDPASGTSTGNGVKDSFSGITFVWHAASVAGSGPAAGSAPATSLPPDNEPTYHY